VNVLLVGAEAAGARALQLAQAAGQTVVGVLTPRGEGPGAALAAAADRAQVPVHDPALVRDPGFAARIRDWEIDLLLNIHSLHLIQPEVLEAPRIGSFNLHPGPLPRYAGLSVPSWAIYNGEREHGVTLHWMAADVDAGHVAYEASMPISETETGLSLSAACVREGLPLVERLLADAQREEIPAHPQDLAERRWYGPKGPHGGCMPWTLPARTAVDLIRASDYGPFPSPWGRPRTLAGERELEVLAAKPTGEPAGSSAPGTVGGSDGEAVRVAAADEWVLVERVRDGDAVLPAANCLLIGAILREPDTGACDSGRSG
jgi:methionyl-tRNA formyltransferase